MSVGNVQGGGAGSVLGRMLSIIRGAPPPAIRDLDGTERVAALIRKRMQDGVDPSNAMLLHDLDRAFGRALPPAGHVASPAEFFSYGERLPADQGYQALGGTGGDRAFMDSVVGQSILNALKTDPNFRERLESALGGRMLPVGTEDGRMMVHRAPASQPASLPVMQAAGNAAPSTLPTMAVMQAARAQGSAGVSRALGPILTGLQQMEANIARMAQELGRAGQPATGTYQDVQSAISVRAAQAPATPGGPPQLQQPFSPTMREGMAAAPQAQVPGQAQLAGAAQAQVGGVNPGQQAAMSETARQQALNYQLNNLKKFYELLSNIMKQSHDTQVAAIKNIT